MLSAGLAKSTLKQTVAAPVNEVVADENSVNGRIVLQGAVVTVVGWNLTPLRGVSTTTMIEAVPERFLQWRLRVQVRSLVPKTRVAPVVKGGAKTYHWGGAKCTTWVVPDGPGRGRGWGLRIDVVAGFGV